MDQFAERPVAGEGAGSFESWWAQNGTLRKFLRDAHSLYLETMGELGVLGLLALLGMFGTGFVAAIGASCAWAGPIARPSRRSPPSWPDSRSPPASTGCGS